MKATAQIFLSYAREDEKKVEKLHQRLSEIGFKPWMDKKDILPGERWELAIQKAIRHSDFFLVCLSTNSMDKRGWIQREIKQALDIWQEKLDSDIYLIPVRLEECEVPERLRDFQWVNLFEEDGWTRLMKAIQVGMERQGKVIKAEEKEVVGNPFVYGNPISDPRYFYGRHQEIRRVIERLTNPGFESSSIVGGRRIGKTSLLQVLQHRQMRERFGLPDEFVFINISLAQRSDMTQDKFWRLVLEKMQSTFADERLRNQIAMILREKEKIGLYDVEPLFEAIVTQGFRPILLLDEFENAFQSPELGGDFYLGLRSLITAHRLAVVTATGQGLAYYERPKETAASPFFNVFTDIYLFSFSIQEAHELIEGYLEGTGVSFTQGDVEWVTRTSGCHPYFLQLACYYLFEAYREKKRLTRDDRGKARQVVEEDPSVQAELEKHFTYYWKHSSENEQSVLATLAQRSQAHGLRAWIANILYKTLRGRHALTSLVNQGIVVESDGDHQIFSPLFAKWILSQQSGTTVKILSAIEESLAKLRQIAPLLLAVAVAIVSAFYFGPDLYDWTRAAVFKSAKQTSIAGLRSSDGKEIQVSIYSPIYLAIGSSGTIQAVSHNPDEKPDINVIPQPNSGIIATRDKDNPDKFLIDCIDTNPSSIPIRGTEYRQIDVLATMPKTGDRRAATISIKTNYALSLFTQLVILASSAVGTLAALTVGIKKILFPHSTASTPNPEPRS